MAKPIKPIVQKMNGKTLTTRQASRIAQNERRKAQRRLARILTEETGQKVNWKEAFNVASSIKDKSEQVKALSNIIEDLTSKPSKETFQRKGYATSIESIAKSISTFTRERFGRETLSKKGKEPDLFRRNEMFTHQLNQATRKEGLSTLNSNQVHGFYTSTMWIWNGSSSSDNRNAMIMKEFGLIFLSQVYNLITKKELNPYDFGFDVSEENWEHYKNDEIEEIDDTDEIENIQMFEEWLDEIRSRVKLDELREIFHEEINVEHDVPSVKYDKNAAANIKFKIGLAKFKRNG